MPGYPDGIGGGRPNLSGGLRVDLVGLLGYQDLPGYPDTKICLDTMVCQLGTSQVPAGTSWYQLVPAGTSWYQLAPLGCPDAKVSPGYPDGFCLPGLVCPDRLVLPGYTARKLFQPFARMPGYV